MKLSTHKNLSEGMYYGEYADIAYMTGNKRWILWRRKSLIYITDISFYYSKLLEILIKNLYSKGAYKNIHNHHILKWMFTYIFSRSKDEKLSCR